MIACSPTYLPEDANPGTDNGAGVDAGMDSDAVVEPKPSTDGGDVVDAAPPSSRFCSSVGLPDGAAPNTDLICADFDGPIVTEGATASADAGLTATSMTAISAPNALLAKAPFGTTFQKRGPSVEWSRLGAPITLLDGTVGVNRAAPIGVTGSGQTGPIEVFALTTELTRTALYFSRTDGWMVRTTFSGAGYNESQDLITTQLVEGKWTRVTLRYNVRTGRVVVLYDGVIVFSKVKYSVPVALADSKATIVLGAVASGSTSFEDFRFDNLVATVTRE